jgi:hypothetical protein
MADFDSRLPIKGLGIYAASTNSDPNTTGLTGHVRGVTPADADLTIRNTAAQANTDNIGPNTIWGIDVNSFLHGYDATNDDWDRLQLTGGSLNVNITGSSVVQDVDLDGVYASPTNTNPDNVGIIAHTRAATPGDPEQTFRSTGAVPADAVVNANVHALDVNSFNMLYNGTTWDRWQGTGGSANVTITNITSTTALPVDVDGIYNAVTNTDPDNVGLIVAVRATTPADTDQTLRLTGKNGTVDTTVWALDVSMHDQNGNSYTSSNPLYVSTVDGGTSVNDYNTATVAAGASSNHDYTVTALKTLRLKQIEGSGSGKMKIEVRVETGVATGIFNTRWVMFNSTATPNMSLHIDNQVSVAAGVRVRVIRTNRDNQSQDVYTTISGSEI